MDDFGTLVNNFGLRPQGKAAPMTQSRPSIGSDGPDRPPVFDDVFHNPPKSTSSSFPEFDYDSIFNNNNKSNNNNNSYRSSSPVYDKPVYDEDIFDGLPGVKSKSTSSRVNYDENENVFATMSTHKQNRNHGVEFDDFLGNLGRGDKLESKSNKGSKGFDDLLHGFGASSPQRGSRSGSESSQSLKTSVKSTKPTTSMVDDPFVVLQSTSTPTNSSPKVFVDPLDEIGKLGSYTNKKASRSSVSGPVYDDIDPLNGFGKSAPAFSSETNKEHGHSRGVSSEDRTQSTLRTEPIGKPSFRDSASQSQKMPDDNFQELNQPIFDIPSVSTGFPKSVGQMASPSYVNPEFRELNSDLDASPGSDGQLGSSEDAWLTVSEVPLFTQPTLAPPPSRPPPPIPGRPLKSETGFYNSISRKKGNDFSSYPSYSEYSQNPKPSSHNVNNNMGSPIDELESFAMGRTRQSNVQSADTHDSEEMDTNSSAATSAAAMKEAMDRAEAKFRQAKEVREREHVKSARNRESVQVEKDEHVTLDEQERENEERLERERRQRDEEEERRRLERERERAREEREKARQAVQRATREARERAAIEARERAAAETRRKSERAAVERAQAEARERAERAAVQRAQAEARERAAADAREKAEKTAAEARERANAEMKDKAAANARAEAEARRKSERAAVDRAAAEARERAASAAWTNQQKNDNSRMNQQQKSNDNDLESFFSMNSRPTSAPRPRDPTVDPLFQSKSGSEGTKRTSSVNTSVNMKKPPAATNFVDDLSSIFGGTASSGDFQEVEGETGERRKARLDRHQRTQERAAKALAEKISETFKVKGNKKKERIGESLDIEVKRWAAGKEGNLRALLSTLQYVLWPECGWTPVSLTDLITGASVKKVYRKATLCIHPDKVQQKGANLQQKYIAEKVFDLLKEAWNKFNSEELF